MELFNELYTRNPALAVFGWICLGGALFCIIMTQVNDTQVLGINAWIKPLKFFASITVFVWSMAWYMDYLPDQWHVKPYSWLTIVVLAFELVWISYQASRGQLSHFNVSSPLNGTMFALMGIAIAIMTLYTAYIGILFFRYDFPTLPVAYLWGIRLGIIVFVIFAFEGFLMGSNLAHTVGAPDGGPGLPLVNWSITAGDLRVAHFVGMHALQVLPLLGFYLVHSVRGIIIVGLIYLFLAGGILFQALMGIPIVRA